MRKVDVTLQTSCFNCMCDGLMWNVADDCERNVKTFKGIVCVLQEFYRDVTMWHKEFKTSNDNGNIKFRL